MPLFSIVANHRKRAYLFNLNSTETIDSSNLSNESRYINHDQEFDNCHAIGRRHIFSLQIQLDHLSQSAAPFLFFFSLFLLVFLVNGEHRIGMYAGQSSPESYALLEAGSPHLVQPSRYPLVPKSSSTTGTNSSTRTCPRSRVHVKMPTRN